MSLPLPDLPGLPTVPDAEEGRMADITITIPNDHIERAVDALCAAGGYSGSPDDQRARRQFAKAEIAKFVRRTVMEHERQKAMSQAMAAVTVEPITVD